MPIITPFLSFSVHFPDPFRSLNWSPYLIISPSSNILYFVFIAASFSFSRISTNWYYYALFTVTSHFKGVLPAIEFTGDPGICGAEFPLVMGLLAQKQLCLCGKSAQNGATPMKLTNLPLCSMVIAIAGRPIISLASQAAVSLSVLATNCAPVSGWIETAQ